MTGLGMFDRLHFLHRAWRYRLRSERQELSYMMSLDLRGRTVVDIGAHRGLYSWWMRRAVGPSGRIVSFEPQPEMIEQLHRMRATFRIANMSIVEMGLSSSPGVATLRRSGTHTGGASLEHEAAADTTAFDIRLTTLDDYVASNSVGPVSFIKCDVEGHEREVFRGANRVLTTDRPTLLVECHDKHALDGEFFAELATIGYSGHFLHDGRRTPVARLKQMRDSIAAPYLNYVFEPI